MKYEEMSDREMIRNPDVWPAWPFLPMKNYNTDSTKDLGVMLAHYDKERWPNEKIVPIVIQVNLIDILPLIRPPENELTPIIFKYMVENLPKVEFESLDALLAAGWVVD